MLSYQHQGTPWGGVGEMSPVTNVLALISPVESCYDLPNDFVPERWYSKPEMIKDDTGFSPFSVGAFYSFCPKGFVYHV